MLHLADPYSFPSLSHRPLAHLANRRLLSRSLLIYDFAGAVNFALFSLFSSFFFFIWKCFHVILFILPSTSFTLSHLQFYISSPYSRIRRKNEREYSVTNDLMQNEERLHPLRTLLNPYSMSGKFWYNNYVHTEPICILYSVCENTIPLYAEVVFIRNMWHSVRKTGHLGITVSFFFLFFKPKFYQLLLLMKTFNDYIFYISLLTHEELRRVISLWNEFNPLFVSVYNCISTKWHLFSCIDTSPIHYDRYYIGRYNLPTPAFPCQNAFLWWPRTSLP